MNTTDVSNRVKELQERAGEVARTAGTTTDRYVRENTWIAIGMAALLGCMVGYLLTSHDD